MNLSRPLDDLEWQTLIQHTAAYFNDLTIKRGFQYYKQDRVSSMQLHENGHIGAVVYGNEVYIVDLAVGALEDSRCTCPVENSCKHMVAVLLSAAAKQGRSVHALVNAHSTSLIRAGELPPSQPDHRQDSLRASLTKQNEALARLKKQAATLPEQPISVWHDLFDETLGTMGLHPSSSLYARNALEGLTAIKPPLCGFYDTLYELHMRLYVLQRLVRQPHSSVSGATLFMGYHVQMAADDIEQDIISRFAAGQWVLRPGDPAGEAEEAGSGGAELSETGSRVAGFAIADAAGTEKRLSETLDHLRGKMLTEAQSHPFFSRIYHHLWLEGIRPYVHDHEWYFLELKQLQAAEERYGKAHSRSAALLAQCLMHFCMEQDTEAWKLLRAADQALYLQPQQVLRFLDIPARAQDWTRLKDWLVETGPFLAGYRSQSLDPYMSYWNLAAEHIPGADEQMWDTLAAMLPYSESIYQEALHERGEWKRWMDYQLSTGREPLEFRVSVLTPIEKEAPELLLPFYHQAVERYIQQKNRSSYKSAVKLLKRLAKLYKKLKREERWEGFIASLSDRHSRLRALQEELRKGKLIS